MSRAAERAALAAALGLLTVGFLQACSLTFGRAVISFALWPTLALAAFAFCARLTRRRRFRGMGLPLMAAFCASMLVSLLLNLRFGWYGGVRSLAMQAILFFVVYARPDDEPADDARRRFALLALCYIAGCAVLSLLSFALFSHDETFVPETGPLYFIGFHNGRLFGAYWDANIGAVMNAVSAVLSLGLICRPARGTSARLTLAAVILLDAAYIAFSDSRTGRVALIVGAVAFALARLRAAPIRRRAAAAAAALALAAVLPVGIKASYNALAARGTTALAEPPAAPAGTPAPAADGTLATPAILGVDDTADGLCVRWTAVDGASLYRVFRQRDDGGWRTLGETAGTSFTDGTAAPGGTYVYTVRCLSADGTHYESGYPAGTAATRAADATIGRRSAVERTDISNRRFDIWRSALELWTARPLFGAGHDNLLALAAAEMPDTYIVSNSHMDYDTMHNTPLDVLAGQGAAGLLCYIAMAAYFAVRLMRRRPGAAEAARFAVVVMLAAASLFMTELVYTASPMTVLFWAALGTLMRREDGAWKSF